MSLIWRFVRIVSYVASIAIAVPVLFSGSLRSDYALAINRKLASIWPPKYAFVGNSLTVGCNWSWELGSLSVINLAKGGVIIREVARQLVQVLPLKPNYIFVEAGINDVLDGSSAERIAYDYEFLLHQLPTDQKAIVTLMPFVSARSLTDSIETANSTIRSQAESRGLPVIDLNSVTANQGIRKPNMTTDGVHFTHKACLAWVEEVRTKVNSVSAKSVGN